jgi:N-acetylglucosamine-6-phosphate deacetylase
MVLITDAISAMGLEEGSHCLGKKTISIKKDNFDTPRAYIDGTDILCGAVATMNDCLRNLITNTGCSIAHAVACASEHPAKLLNIFPKKGSLEYGADADFVIIDDNINATATFLNGDLAWSKRDWKPNFESNIYS